MVIRHRVTWALLVLAAFGCVPVPGAPASLRFMEKTYLGDSFTLDRCMNATVHIDRTVNGKIQPPIDMGTLDHDRFDQTVAAVDEAGLPTAIRRRYQVATRAEAPVGATMEAKPRAMHGRRVTISRASGRLVVSGSEGVAPYDQTSLERSLGDDLCLYLPMGTHAVGETWDAPLALRNTFSQDSKGSSVCRFIGVRDVNGSPCAIIAVVVSLMGTETGGWQFTLTGSATITWSIPLRRVVEFSYRGTTNLQQTVTHGSDTTEAHIVATVARNDSVGWHRLAGKPVPATSQYPKVRPGSKPVPLNTAGG